ncbi:MAG: Gram-negative bacterial TonB protein C-terminal [Pseudomonadota bacterium]|jgi:TonB family protein
MANLMTDRSRHVTLLRPRWILLVALGGLNAQAQTASPASSAPAPGTPVIAVGAAPSEAAQRQALGPYRMILRSAALPTTKAKPANASHATSAASHNAPKTVSEPAPAPSPAAPAPAVAAIPVTTPVVQSVEVPTPPADETPAPATTLTAASSPAAAPAPVATPARTALVLVKNDPPTLSGPLARESPTGTVRVSFSVNPDGSTSDLKIAASSNRRLNSAVLAAIGKWRYQPIDAAQTTEVEMVFSGE